MGRLLAFVVALAVSLALVIPRQALAVDRTFAGSAQIDYMFVPTSKSANARADTFDGFTLEAAFKVGVDVTEHLSATAKLCYGCHGFEMDMAYLDYRVSDEFGVRLGRFSPSFGSFNLRHDPANHVLSDKPLPYDMGRMLRYTEWNVGVLPSPFPDNGLEFSGTYFAKESLQVDYAAYAITGFRADKGSIDLDFKQNHAPYYIDNNARPSIGARIAASSTFGTAADVTFGLSGMGGTYDPANAQTYGIYGADFSFRLRATNVRLEYLLRRQTFDISDPTVFKYEIPTQHGDVFVKHGGYLEVEHQVTSKVALVTRADGLFRTGNVSSRSTLSSQDSVVRFTIGSAVSLDRGLKLKVSSELWRFGDTDDSGNRVAFSLHLGAVGTF